MTARPRVAITNCGPGGSLLHAAWLAQELLSTFAEDLALIPRTGGVIEITLDDAVIRGRKRDDGFPDAATLKRKRHLNVLAFRHR